MKKQTLKKSLALLISIMLILSIIPFGTFTVSAEQDGDYTYSVENGNATITGYNGNGGDITIPSTLGGYPVTNIKSSAFYGCSNLTSLTIPNGITSIGSYMFYWCYNLKSVTIPSSVTSIGISAFEGCANLTSINLPNSVVSIGDWVFEDCNSLSSINVDTDNDYYSSLDGVLFDKDKTNLIRCPAAKSGDYIIPNGVINIGNYAFSNCSGLKNITMPNGIVNIERDAFINCNNLISINIPNSVTNIENYAFASCSSLTSVTLGSSVTSIGYRTFGSCSSLTSIIIPNSVTSIDNRAFNCCAGLTNINVDEKNINYSSLDGILFNKDKTKLICFPGGKPDVYTIPDSVTSIDSYAFYECTGLTSINLGNGVTSIGNDAFGFCTGLISVNIGSSVTSIGSFAFSGCENLTIYCHENSYAMNYAIENDIKYAFMVIGDPSGDGVVDADDLTYFRKALLSGEKSFDERLDVTGDGKFDLTDLVRLKKHLANNNIPLGKIG
ncbi:MAG: leucine-rich repeat protein [Clostridia bacterium]|nr:leucine-rich repeat protein [Clostridia bacterium]